MYKIFYNNKPIIFTEQVTKYVVNNHNIFCRFGTEDSLKLVLELFKNDNNVNKLFENHNSMEDFMLTFKSLFVNIEAAGGLVKNAQNEILFIYRLNKWDLPKGKKELNETSENTALREVKEECGIHNLKIIRALATTYHIYIMNNQKILKTTYWFEMLTSSNQKLTPQLEEDIQKVCWFNNTEVNDIVLQNTYQTIKEVLIA